MLTWPQVLYVPTLGVELTEAPRFKLQEAIQLLKKGKAVKCVQGNHNANVGLSIQFINGEVWTSYESRWVKSHDDTSIALGHLRDWDPESEWNEIPTMPTPTR